MALSRGGAVDPRSTMSEAEREAFSRRGRPQVAQGGGARDALALGLGLGAALLLGAFVFQSLRGSRAQPARAVVTQPAPAPVVAQAVPPPVPAKPTPVAQNPQISARDMHTPVLVLDKTPAHAATGAEPPRKDGKIAGADPLLGEEPPITVRTQPMAEPSRTIAQGTLIPAVLETAINSDLPGYTRAIVSHDVHSYDGSQVLIPQGSRLVGRYKSGLKAGQERAYVVWSRLLLPSGTSVQLGSPMVDKMGETGAAGDVDEHYLERFGPATMFSILGGLIGLAGKNDTAIITTTSQAQSVASVALQRDGAIPPTIRIRPGQPIQVFVSRDLVFGN